MNTLTGERKDEKPFGLVLDKEDKQLWENCQKNVKKFLLLILFLGYRL